MSTDNDVVRAALAAFGPKAQKLVVLTLKDADRFMAEIESAIDQGDAEAVGLAAHSLKSIMKQVGADTVGGLAFGMEKNGKAGDMGNCGKQLPALRECYAETRQLLVSIAQAS